MRSSEGIIVALLATLAFAGTAAAGSKEDKAKSQENSARAACLLGDYQTGTKILVDLFIQTGKPVHIFNQGRCYEQNHRWEEALDRFREFMRKSPNAPESIQRVVETHIAECESHMPKTGVVSPAPPEAPIITPSSVAPPAQAPTAATAPVASPAVVSDPGATLRIVGIVTAAVGVAALGFGTYEYFRHESLVDDLKKNSGQFSDDQFSDKQGQINDSKTMSWVGFGIGATALVAGTTMYFLGRASASGGTGHAALTLMPGISPGQTSLFLSGVF